MPATLLLPPGTYNLTVPQPGDWTHFAGFETLKALADGLRAADQTDPSMADLVSIPDVWAQVQLVESALRDEKHSLHARIVGEWRGLLGLLALAGQRGFPIKVQPLDLTQIRPDGPGSAPKVGSFAAVLHALMPRGRLAEDGDWHNLALILYRERPIGLFVPNTLVCPIRDYAGALDEAITFRHAGRLTDPCRSQALVSEDFHVIAALLGTLNDALMRTKGDDLLKKAIADQLQSYRTTCIQKAGDDIAHERIGRDTLALPQLHTVFNGFRTVRHITGSGAFVSCLPPRSEFSNLLKGGIIVDPALPTFLGGSAETTRIWDRFTLSQWLTQPELNATIRRAAAEAGYLVLTAEDVFTATLCQLEKDTVGEHPREAKNLVLPFTAPMLMFLSPTALAQAVRVERHGMNAVTVSLTLGVQGAYGGQKTVTLSRSYSLTNRTIIKTINTTRLVTWPNFTRSDWTRHILYHTGNSSLDIYPKACFTLASGLAAVKKLEDERTAAIMRALDRHLAEQQDKNRFPDEVTRFQRGGMIKLTDPIEAAVCTQGDEKVPVGLILFPALKRVEAVNQPAEIGIDFGTTNTIVYARLGEEMPRSLSFEDRHVTPYAEGLSEDDKAIVGMDFLPPYAPTTPFMTLLRQRNLTSGGTVREAILTDRIFYLFDVARPISELALEQAPNRTGATDHTIRVDLKWGKGRAEEIRLFLTQVALQTLAEVAMAGGSLTGVKWHVSYPQAFSAQHREAFEGLMRKAIAVALPMEKASPTQPSVTESLAAAYYFASREVEGALAQFSDNVITIDIGGGTTDISLWQTKTLVWQTSLMLAGRNLLIDFLLNDLKYKQRQGTVGDTLFTAMMRNNPGIKPVSDSITEYMKAGGAKITAGLEMFVNHRQFAAAFASPLVDYMDNQGFQRLAAIADLSLAGILYYVAGMIRTLTDQKVIRNSGQSTFICLGGRGSLLFKTAIGQSQQERIAALFREAAGLSQKVEFIFSERPKEEVACGLLYSASAQQSLTVAPNAVARDFIIGERIRVGDEEIGPGTPMVKLPTTGDWRVDRNQELETFVKTASRTLMRSIDLEKAVLDKVRDVVNGDLSNRLAFRKAELGGQAPAGESAEGLQPPFIIGLRALIAEIAARGINMPLRG